MGEKGFWTAFDTHYWVIKNRLSNDYNTTVSAREPSSDSSHFSAGCLNELSTAAKMAGQCIKVLHVSHESLCPVTSIFGGWHSVVAHSLFNESCSTGHKATDTAEHSAESVTRVAIDVRAPPTLAGWLWQLIAKNGASKHEVSR